MNRRTLNKILLAVLFAGLSSCANPFNLKAINAEVGLIPFFGKTSAELISGATQTATTAAGYKVSTSVGSFVNQPSITTAGGYKVFSTIQTTQ
ncbi:MAG: hypothetical protein H7061_05600 [Bdellovibrionaceae bacterium]|nr:hypothetical protein [Bdellovibrio sp.]